MDVVQSNPGKLLPMKDADEDGGDGKVAAQKILEEQDWT